VAKRIIHDDGNVSVEFSADELAALFDLTHQQLHDWAEVLNPLADDIGNTYYRFSARDEMRKIRHRLLILRSGVTIQQLEAIEQSGEQILQGYAAFAQDAPAGISAIVWRTYAIVVYMQVQYSKALTAEELAIHANGHLDDIDPLTGEIKPSAELAAQHLRLLQNVGALRWTGSGWDHIGLPVCMRKQEQTASPEAVRA
jgi:DNA-binding transcriptional MerR regulator